MGPVALVLLRVDAKTTPFDQAIVAIQFVLEQASMSKIVFLYNEYGVLDLTDLKQQAFVLAKEPDPIPSLKAGRNGYDNISFFVVPHDSRIRSPLGSISFIQRKNRRNMRPRRKGGGIFFNTARGKCAKAQEKSSDSGKQQFCRSFFRVRHGQRV